MKTTTTERARHLFVRCATGERLPDVILDMLREERVTAGWLRGSGVLEEVELRTFSTDIAGLGATRKLSGTVHVLTLDGSVGLAKGEPSVGLRAVIARETDRGMETLSGEIVGARVLGFEALVTALDDVAIGRTYDRTAGVTLIEGERQGGGELPRPPREREASESAPREAAPKGPPAAWADAVRASEDEDRAPPLRAASTNAGGPAIPPRPVRAAAVVEESVFPEGGDIVEHFAFGRCEVLKSDGDRLHLKVGKDGRIREIALEMLRVTELDSNGPHRRFKLDRKL